MSYRTLLRHRATIKRNTVVAVDGVSSYSWRNIQTEVPCRVDLSYIRRGKDPQWSPEAGRVQDRTGVAFFMPDAQVTTGDRIVLTSGGVAGTFLVDGTVEEILGNRGGVHHLEVPLAEVPGPLARAVS
jgi:hypothetical protein